MISFSAHNIPVQGGAIGSLRLNSAYKNAAALIWINGGPGGTYVDENHSIGAVTQDRDVILYDQLGSHHSPAAFDASLTSMPRFVEELKTVFDYHGIDQAILLGHSFGGSVAVDFALQYPDRVKAAIFSSPLLSTPRWIDDANLLLSQMPLKERDIIQRQLQHNDVEEAVYEAAERVFYNRHLCRLDPWPERLLQGFSKSNREIYRAMWGISEFTCTGTLKDYDRFPDLAQLSMPVFLTCGRYDEATPETIGDAARKIKGAQFQVFEQSSHTPAYEEPETYISAMRGFTNGL